MGLLTRDDTILQVARKRVPPPAGAGGFQGAGLNGSRRGSAEESKFTASISTTYDLDTVKILDAGADSIYIITKKTIIRLIWKGHQADEKPADRGVNMKLHLFGGRGNPLTNYCFDPFKRGTEQRERSRAKLPCARPACERCNEACCGRPPFSHTLNQAV